MARKPVLETVERLLLMRDDIPAATKRELIHEIRRELFGRNTDPNVLWDALVARLRHDRASIATNRKRWRADITRLYNDYLALLDKVLVRINGARLKYPTVADAMEDAKKRNLARTAQGEYPTGDCGPAWQSWIPPHLIAALVSEQDRIYTARSKTERQGKRSTLFVSQNLRTRVHKRLKQAQTGLDNLRRIMRTDGGTAPSEAHANTPYRALYLTALRQAELRLAAIERELTRGQRPYWEAKIPVNWYALLEPEMRTRLREANDNPHKVTLDGLTSFYKPDEVNNPGTSVPEQELPEISPDDGDDTTTDMLDTGEDEEGYGLDG
jgi:hypothetical protein